jgi:hypothetical protein
VAHRETGALAPNLFSGSAVILSPAAWFEGNFQDYEEDKKRRLGIDSTIPKRIKYKQFTR